jgi:NADH dehydrogenase
MNKNIVIVGGGFGGVKLALELAHDTRFSVTLVSDKMNFEYHAALYRSATGTSPLEVVLPLRRMFAHAENVELIHGKVTTVEENKKLLQTESGQSISYDELVLAVGLELNNFGIAGISEHAYSLDTISHTIRLRNHLHDVLTSDKRAHHFVVVGAGASGVELAAELKLYLNRLCSNHQQALENIHVTLVEASDRVLPMLSPRASRLTLKRLLRLGVVVRLNTMVQSLDEVGVTLSDGTIKTETLIWTAGSKNNQLFTNHPNVFKFSSRKRVVVDEQLAAAKNIFVVGDSAETTYSGMAQTALHDAMFVAKLLKSDRPQNITYHPKLPIYAIPTGGRSSIVQWNGAVLSGYFGWLLRRSADFRLFAYFEPLHQAIKDWQSGNRSATVATCPLCRHPHAVR